MLPEDGNKYTRAESRWRCTALHKENDVFYAPVTHIYVHFLKFILKTWALHWEVVSKDSSRGSLSATQAPAQ